MDPGHYTAYLLVIVICILLLLLVASALLMCYLRKNSFNIRNRKSPMRLGAAMRNQSTSMTSFAWNFMDPKLPILSDLHDPQGTSLPITVDRSKQPTSLLSLDSHMLYISDDEEGTQTSGLDSKSARKKSDLSAQYSVKYIFSSGASVLASVLERSSTFSLKAKRRSSSLKSGINEDILMVPLESPVHDSSLAAEAFQAAVLPINLSRSSTLLCENSSDQQFTWDSSSLSIKSNHLTEKETNFIPSAIQNQPCIPEGPIKKDEVQLRSPPDFLQPKAWFVSIESRPVSNGVQLEKKELNNIASLDSGVDAAGLLLRSGYGGLNMIAKVLSIHGTENYVPPSSPKEPSTVGNSGEELREVKRTEQECDKVYITHQEAVRKLNPGYSFRSLWEKREERPIVGVN